MSFSEECVISKINVGASFKMFDGQFEEKARVGLCFLFPSLKTNYAKFYENQQIKYCRYFNFEA